MSEKNNFCPNCGAKLKENAGFCPNCGFKLNKASASNNQSSDKKQTEANPKKTKKSEVKPVK